MREFKLGERYEFVIESMPVRIEKDKTIYYEFVTEQGEIIAYDTLLSYKEILDRRFGETNVISAIVNYINDFNGKLVISNTRFKKRKILV